MEVEHNHQLMDVDSHGGANGGPIDPIHGTCQCLLSSKIAVQREILYYTIYIYILFIYIYNNIQYTYRFVGVSTFPDM